MEKEFIESLEADGKIILDKLKLALQTEKHSNYKVLINNLRETVNLIYDIKGNGKKDIKIDNLNVDKVTAKNIKGFIDEMYQYARTGCDTFNDNKDKKHGNILDPVDNSIASVNYLKNTIPIYVNCDRTEAEIFYNDNYIFFNDTIKNRPQKIVNYIKQIGKDLNYNIEVLVEKKGNMLLCDYLEEHNIKYRCLNVQVIK